MHAGLLAAGAKPGTPVSFNPEYKAATGQIVDVYVLWKDAAGEKHQARAQDWVQDIKTQKPMTHDWVFAGSGFWKDEETATVLSSQRRRLDLCLQFSNRHAHLPVETHRPTTI